MKPPIHDRGLEQEFTAQSWSRGRRYFEQGRVLEVRGGGMAWEGEVQGTRRRPYHTWLELEEDDGGVWLDGDCTCPAAVPCKHVAALLCAAREASAKKTRGGAGASRGPDWRALERWGKRLEEDVRGREGARAATAGRRERLVYVLRLEGEHLARSWLGVEARLARLNKSGLSKGARFDLGRAVALPYGRVAACVSDEDRLLWYQLTRLGVDEPHRSSFEPGFSIDPRGTRLFRDFVETGRCHLFDTSMPPLWNGEPRAGVIDWRLDATGDQSLTIQPADESASFDLIIPLWPPHYVELESGRTGPIELDVPEAVGVAVLDLPAIAAEVAGALPEELGAVFDRHQLPRPPVLPVRTIDAREAKAVLTLSSEYDEPVATMHFAYGPLRIGFDDPLAPDGREREIVDGEIVDVERNPRYEQARLLALEEQGFRAEGGSDGVRLDLPDTRAWLDFVAEGIPALREDGWEVRVEPDFPIDLVESEGWYMDLEPDGGEWFELELGVEIDGERVSLLPAVVDAIRAGELVRDRIHLEQETIRLPLGDGRWVGLPRERLARVIDVLVELFDERLDDGRLRMRQLDAGRLLSLEGFSWTGGERLRKLAGQLTRRDPLPAVRPPRALRATLRDYQRRGLEWLALLRAHGFGGVLADDMGLGKTVQTLAHLLAEKRARRLDRPCLVVAPRSVLGNWARECERFAPTLGCAIYHGPGREQVLDDPPNVVITTYALLQRDEALREREWHVVVFDEAQALKNPRTKLATAARQLDARQRLCLSGTPMENNLEELWSLFSIVVPGLLGDLRRFREYYRRPIERDANAGRLEALTARIAPFMLRRTKEQVLEELPPKTEVVLTVPLDTRQRDLYESVRMTMEKRVRRALDERGLAKSHIVVLDALLKLRQVCCHPALVKSETARKSKAHSAKTERLVELLTELLAEGRRTIVFSQFTSMLDIVGAQLDRLKVPYRQITGRTRKRQPIIDAFQAGEFPVLLISLKAGGTGINLTNADTVIHYDPWWNPAVEDQATDRTHRIGQTRPVTVYRLVCEGTVEQRVLALQERKRALTQAVQRDAERRGADGLGLDARDVELLLSPAAAG